MHRTLRVIAAASTALLIASLLPAIAAAGTAGCHVVKFNAAGMAVGRYTSLLDAIGGGPDSDTGSTLMITGTCAGGVDVIVSMNLVGRGRATLDGGGHRAVLSTLPGTTVNITNLTIKGGSSEGIAGLVNFGNTHLTDSSVIGNTGCNGGIANSGALTIEDSTVSGNSSPFNCGGAGIHNTGTLALIRTTVDENTSGGIANGGTMTITDSSIDRNTSLSYGGGIYNWGTAVITNSSVSENTAAFGGGGLSNTALATMTVMDSIIRGNTAGHGGGGVINGGGINNAGSLTLTRSTVDGNHATLWGGAILNIGGYGGSLTLDGSTIGSASQPNTSGYQGAGIFNFGSVVTFVNHTTEIAYNQAALAGGGIYNRADSSTIPVAGTVLCGSPSLVIYGAGNSPDNSYDETMGVNTICP